MYVNYLGQQIGLINHGPKSKPKREAPLEYHKGWRAQGIPPGALEAAEKAHPQLVADAISWNERLAKKEVFGKAKPVPPAWDADRWLNEAKRVPVRAKPYEVQEAAELCKQMAEKSGWLRVEVIEVKKMKSA